MAVDYQRIVFNTDDSALVDRMKKYKISQKMLDESIDQLVSYFKMQPYLPDIKKDDPRLKRILAINNFSTETSKKKIENLFTARSLMPEFFANRDIQNPEMKKYIDALDVFIMPKLTPDNYRVTIMRTTTGDVDLFDPVVFHKINSMVGDFRLYYETVFEDIFIVDLSLATVQHGLKINPLLLKKVTFLTQECYSSKIKALHVVNVPNYMHTLINLSKSMMKKKIADRLQTHCDMNSLHKYVPKECLPTEFGGTAGDSKDIKAILFNSMASSEWRQKFLDFANEKSDESKRPEGSNKNFDFSGGSMDGSFRSLDYD